MKTKQRQWLEIKLSLQHTDHQVERTIAVPDSFTLYDLETFITYLFNFDIDETGWFDLNGHRYNSTNSQIDVEIFQPLSECWEIPMTYYFQGKDIWSVAIQMNYSKQEYDVVKLLDATGLELSHANMTISDFNLMDVDETLDLVALDYEMMSMGKALDVLFLGDDVSVPEPVASNTFDPHADLVYFYTQIVGLSEEQASYQILYETALDKIVATMESQGYDEDIIEKTIMGSIAFEEHLYEVLEHDIDILQTLPARADIFTAEDEEYLQKVQDEMFDFLESKNIAAEQFTTTNELITDELEQEFIQILKNLRNNILS